MKENPLKIKAWTSPFNLPAKRAPNLAAIIEGSDMHIAVYRLAESCSKNWLAPTVAAKLREVRLVPVAAICVRPINGDVSDGIIT